VYDEFMRFVLLAIFVLLAAQPLPAVSCDMHGEQGTTHNESSNMPMDHGGQDMDCCDQDPETPGDNCGSLSHCGACPTGLVGLAPSALNMAFDPASQPYLPATGVPLKRIASPPFRPPIA
jgi:hypothetical protein